jgi:hypothetical protein
MITITKDDIFHDLKIIFWRALNTNKLHIALRVVELQTRFLGMFEKQRLPEVKRFSDMTEEQLRDFIAVLEKNDPELKGQDEELEDFRLFKEVQESARKDAQKECSPPETEPPEKIPQKGARLWDGVHLTDYEVWPAKDLPKKKPYRDHADPELEHPPPDE